MSVKNTGRSDRLDGAFPSRPLPSHPFAPTALPPADPAMLEASDAAPAPPGDPQAAPARRGPVRISELGLQGYKAGGRRPAPDLEEGLPVRLTAYLTEPQVRALRAEVHRRQSRGKRADLSMLLREAVNAYLADLEKR